MSDNNKSDYENDLLKEFAGSPVNVPESTPATGTVETDKQGKVMNLGSVDMRKYKGDDDPEIKRMHDMLDYVPLEMDAMPTRGRFYQDDTRIYIRAARVGEVREFSMVDEENPSDVIDKMVYILASCTKVMDGNLPVSYKDMLDHDRFYVFKRISELTFKHGETQIQLPVPADACKTPSCKPQKSIVFTSDMLQHAELDPMLEKYYDAENKCYSIRTKTYGTIQIAPPTIGVATAVKQWALERAQEKKEWDPSLVQMIPYIQRDWRRLNDKDIFKLATELASWDITKFNIVYRFIEILNATAGSSPMLKAKCEKCGGDLEVPLTFQSVTGEGGETTGGIKQFFVPTLQNIAGELL